MLRPVAGLLLVALLSGCAATSVVDEGPSPSSTAAVLEDLREAVADVARTQGAADSALTSVLDAVRAVDEAVVGARSVDTYELTLANHGGVHQAVISVSTDDLRDRLFEVADAVDRARVALAAARAALGDPWEVDYLEAEDGVLVAVRSYAEAADRLAQLLQRHWPTYVAVDEEIQAFTERITVERTTEEGVNALALELDPHLADLVVAQEQIADVRQERAAAATRLNEATAAAQEVYASRPDGDASSSDG